jgi:hypothetical protein
MKVDASCLITIDFKENQSEGPQGGGYSMRATTVLNSLPGA